LARITSNLGVHDDGIAIAQFHVRFGAASGGFHNMFGVKPDAVRLLGGFGW